MRPQLAAMLLAVIFAGCGGGGNSSGNTGAHKTAPPLPALKLKGDATAGKRLFISSSCDSCHTLKDAHATATEGPSLDRAKPSFALVVTRVTLGKSPSPNAPPGSAAMPAFNAPNNYMMSHGLTAQQIANIAAYVSSVAGR